LLLYFKLIGEKNTHQFTPANGKGNLGIKASSELTIDE
jgi:hypothetical protein